MIDSMLRCLLYWMYSRRLCRIVLTHGIEGTYLTVPRSSISEQAMADINAAVYYGGDMWKERLCGP